MSVLTWPPEDVTKWTCGTCGSKNEGDRCTGCGRGRGG